MTPTTCKLQTSRRHLLGLLSGDESLSDTDNAGRWPGRRIYRALRRHCRRILPAVPLVVHVDVALAISNSITPAQGGGVGASHRWNGWAAQEGRCHATLADGKAIPVLVVLGRRIMQLYIIIVQHFSKKECNIILIFLGAKQF